MKKTIITVFIVLAALLLALLIWELFFSDTGILHQVYNAGANGINSVFQNFTGGDDKLVPNWDNNGNDQYDDTDSKGETDTFDIDNGK